MYPIIPSREVNCLKHIIDGQHKTSTEFTVYIIENIADFPLEV